LKISAVEILDECGRFLGKYDENTVVSNIFKVDKFKQKLVFVKIIANSKVYFRILENIQ
jgi:hypothetical protein